MLGAVDEEGEGDVDPTAMGAEAPLPVVFEVGERRQRRTASPERWCTRDHHRSHAGDCRCGSRRTGADVPAIVRRHEGIACLLLGNGRYALLGILTEVVARTAPSLDSHFLADLGADWMVMSPLCACVCRLAAVKVIDARSSSNFG